MSTNTQVASFVSDISTSRLSDAEEAGLVLMRSSYLASMRASGVDVELTALHREALTQVDNSARVDVTDLLGWLT
jgi:pyruvate, water dikinase